MATNITPVPNVSSQLERALIAYLKWAFGTQATTLAFHFSNDWHKRTAPCVDILSHRSSEDPPHSRRERCAVRIEFKWPGTDIVGDDTAGTQYTDINATIGVIMAALSQSYGTGDGGFRATCEQITAAGRDLATLGTPAEQALNADMAQFTCHQLIYLGAERAASDGETFWLKEIRHFEITASPANTD